MIGQPPDSLQNPYALKADMLNEQKLYLKHLL